MFSRGLVKYNFSESCFHKSDKFLALRARTGCEHWDRLQVVIKQVFEHNYFKGAKMHVHIMLPLVSITILIGTRHLLIPQFPINYRDCLVSKWTKYLHFSQH